MRILHEGELDQRIKDDPRWSESQREAAEKAAAVDPDARVIGLDARMHPVITAELGGSRAPRSQYAVLRNGAPTKPRTPYAEVWSARRRAPTNTRSST